MWLRLYYGHAAKSVRYGSVTELGERQLTGIQFIRPQNSHCFKTIAATTDFNPYQPDSRSGVAVILCTLRSVPLNSSSALKRMPTSIFSTP